MFLRFPRRKDNGAGWVRLPGASAKVSYASITYGRVPLCVPSILRNFRPVEVETRDGWPSNNVSVPPGSAKGLGLTSLCFTQLKTGTGRGYGEPQKEERSVVLEEKPKSPLNDAEALSPLFFVSPLCYPDDSDAATLIVFVVTT
jgi:hypothetical protein